MRSDREFDRAIATWLEEGADALPNRVLEDVLAQLSATPQRRDRRPAWRETFMTNNMKLVVTVSAAVVLAVVATGLFLGRPAGVGVSVPTPTAGASATPSASSLGTREEVIALIEGYGYEGEDSPSSDGRRRWRAHRGMYESAFVFGDPEVEEVVLSFVMTSERNRFLPELFLDRFAPGSFEFYTSVVYAWANSDPEQTRERRIGDRMVRIATTSEDLATLTVWLPAAGS